MIAEMVLSGLLGVLIGAVAGAWSQRKFGDVAAENLRQQYEAQHRAVATKLALLSLRSEVERCQLYNAHNAQLTKRAPQRLLSLPQGFFERVVVEQIGTLALAPEVVSAVFGYLQLAGRVNVCVDWGQRAITATEASSKLSMGIDAQQEAVALCPTVAEALTNMASAVEQQLSELRERSTEALGLGM